VPNNGQGNWCNDFFQHKTGTIRKFLKSHIFFEARYAAQAFGTSASYEILHKRRRYSALLCKHGEPRMAHGHAVNKMNH